MSDIELSRIRQLAGLTNSEASMLTESADINKYVKAKLSGFLASLLETTAKDLDSIAAQIDGIEMAKLNESSLFMLTDLKMLVGMMAKLKTKY
jgi:hypothetical protein